MTQYKMIGQQFLQIFVGSYCLSQYLIGGVVIMPTKGIITHVTLFYLSTPFDRSIPLILPHEILIIFPSYEH